MTQRFRKLTHSLYECKYHVVFCPKYRFRILKDEIAEYVKQQLYKLCRSKRWSGNSGTQYPRGSCAYNSDHSAQICGIKHTGIFERQGSNQSVRAVSQNREKILGPSFVVTWILCDHDRIRRRKNTLVREMAREKRKRT